MSASINEATTTIIQCYKSLFSLYPKMSPFHYFLTVFKSLETLKSVSDTNPISNFFKPCNSLYLLRVINDFQQLQLVAKLIPDNAIKEFYYNLNLVFKNLIQQELEQCTSSQHIEPQQLSITKS